ncbi:hypothetical protein COV58_00130 [Candidatus Roizmanbacteria bacterium CG11_big_fil_rev_8_21_14_0_20_36_8]|uniref:Uncharacterized protein n=1 Tax=Candidatus Roizmanbacteria bacterium CG11_big_fil_rev_8_21_14_0_20_36_8 TaxID=1974856 RepID=A0A2M6IVK7_9BACT|nr:MAG: hypothetical protein COV58_00130 [Candidatus Roizmanbacteria bacterium CG11_big_fil_rev_8_21_14_0_20_36_8]
MKDINSKTTTFIKAYRSFLRDEGTMPIDQIVRLYKQMSPALHKYADSSDIDIQALVYATLRLPKSIPEICDIFMAQIGESFVREGLKIELWDEVAAPARRRKMYFDGKDKLAVFINSVTDLDDMIGLLSAYEIEWNKIHHKLRLFSSEINQDSLEKVREFLEINPDDWNRIIRVWTIDADAILKKIKANEVHFYARLVRGNYVDYKKAAQKWLENIVENTSYKNLKSRPLYFVSSNIHSLVNNMTGWVNDREEALISFLRENKMLQLLKYWEKIQTGKYPGSRENFLWYILKKYESINRGVREEREEFERNLGIDYIEAKHYLDINAQVFSLKDIGKTSLRSKLGIELLDRVDSEALVLNIDYPLGSGAYMVLSAILQNVSNLKGIYILGKASFLHGSLGDIGLPNEVFDTSSENKFIFNNAFSKEYFEEFESGSVLTNQKVVSTKGTLLHSEDAIREYFLNDYAIIEMEDGPYLNAIYETTHFDRYPKGQTATLLKTPIDIGIIHYASDTPYTKAITLGTRNLGYEGVEATYVSSLAILRRILEMELRGD